MTTFFFDELRLWRGDGREGRPSQSVHERTRRRRRTQRRTQWAKAVAAAATTHVKLAGEAANAMVAAAPSEQPKGGARAKRHRVSGVCPAGRPPPRRGAHDPACALPPHLTIPRSTAHECTPSLPIRARGCAWGDRSHITAHSSLEASRRSARVDVCRRVTENVGIPLT